MANSLNKLFEEVDSIGNSESAGKAIEFIEMHLARIEAERGKKSLEYAAVLNELGMLHRSEADYASAARRFRESAETIEEVEGSSSPEYATAIMNHAGVLRLDSRLSESIELFEEAMSVYADSLGTDSVKYLTAVNNLALCYQDMNDYQTALANHIKGCEGLEGLNDESDEYRIDYATSLYNTGFCFRQLGEGLLGDELVARSINVYRQVLPEDHPLIEHAKAVVGMAAPLR